MENKLYVEKFGDKIKITIYGYFWDLDSNGKAIGLGTVRQKIFETEVDISRDVWSLLVGVE